MAKSSKVFLSYAHGDQDFQDRVLAFADRLEVHGLEVVFDQYEQNPDAGWTKWMEAGFRESEFVVSICTPAYCERINETQDEGTGLGVQWEGSILYNLLQTKPSERSKVQVVQFDSEDTDCIPLPILGNNRFFPKQSDLSDPQFEALYRILTDQPRVERPERGSVVELPVRDRPVPDDLTVLPPRERTEVPRSGTEQRELGMRLDSGVAQQEAESPRRGRPGRPPGRGTFAQRKARMKVNEAWDAYYDVRIEDALGSAKDALRLDGGRVEAILVMARSYDVSLRWVEALESYEHLLDAGTPLSHSDQTRYFIARFMAKGDAEAWTQMERIVSEHPDDINCQLAYALAVEKRGDRRAAKEHLRALILTDPNPWYLSNVAALEWKDGHVAEATELLERAVLMDSARAGAWANLGVGRAESRRFGLAIEALRRSLTLQPRYQFARYALAEVYALMGEDEAAVVPLQELVQGRSHYLPRVLTERTFDPIRDSEIFKEFLASVPPELLSGPSL